MTIKQTDPQYRYVFGPVPSRRFGRSLGVDLLPFKTCSYDCIYCQLGRTARKTVERKSYVPPQAVREEIRQKLAQGVRPDHVTFSGSGEPTLSTDLGFLIREVKQLTDVPVVVLTNGSLLCLPEVRADLEAADIVSPSLDAGDEAMFQRVNRPHPAIGFQEMVDGLVSFQDHFPGRIWLEVFIVEGLTATDDEVEKIRRHLERMRPEKIHLNTAVRPTAELSARAVSLARMERYCAMLGPRAEVIAAASLEDSAEMGGATAQMVLDYLRRRPGTLEDIALGMRLNPNEVLKYITQLKSLGSVEEVRRDTRLFFVAVRG